MLLSKALVDGRGSKYTLAQRHRLYRLGVRRFFRLNQVDGARLTTMGDCGAFNYVREEKPPWSPEEVIEFYAECDFDYGVSVDHVILDYQPEPTEVVKPLRPPDPEWAKRQKLTIEHAAEFLRLHRARRPRFQPLGVAQGWSPRSYAHAVRELQTIGYRHIALGGMVPLKTPEILTCLRAIADVRYPETQFHLLGVTRTEQVLDFRAYGATSFDSTSPFRQAVHGRLRQLLHREAQLRRDPGDADRYQPPSQTEGARWETRPEQRPTPRARLPAALAAYDRAEAPVNAPLRALARYADFLGEPIRTEDYRRTG